MASGGVRTNICVLDRFAWFIHPRDNESLQFPRSISAIFNGWVRTCYLLEVSNTLLLKANEGKSDEVAWCAFNKSDVTVLTVHHTCMAG